MTRRRAPNKDERIAACLLMLKRGDEWLIPEPIRSTGTAEEICACVQWDHAFLHSSGGDTRPQNITPMLTSEHKEKTFGASKATTAGSDIHTAAKSKRLRRKQEEFRTRLLAKDTGTPVPRQKGKAAFPGGNGSRLKKCLDGRVINRETGEVIGGRK